MMPHTGRWPIRLAWRLHPCNEEALRTTVTPHVPALPTPAAKARGHGVNRTLRWRAVLPAGLLLLLLLSVAGPARAQPPPGTDCREHHLSAGDAVIYALDCGPRKDHGLLLVPGWGTDHTIWTPVLEALASRHRVIAIDPRSQGRSSMTAQGNTPEMRAQDIHAVIAQLQLQRVVLAGWSLGAQDVASYAHRHNDGRLSGVVLLDGPLSKGMPRALAEDAEDTRMQLARLNTYRDHPQPYLAAMMQAIFVSPLSQDGIDDLVARARRTPTDIGMASLFNGLFGSDRSAYLDDFTRPVLIVAAASSPARDAQAALAARLPQGQFHAIAETGHAILVDRAPAIAARLEQMLDHALAVP
jgi:pimeloyl-ACP methyl ester carboxylesterase